MNSLLASAALCMAKAALRTRPATLTRLVPSAPVPLVPAALQACEATPPSHTTPLAASPRLTWELPDRRLMSTRLIPARDPRALPAPRPAARPTRSLTTPSVPRAGPARPARPADRLPVEISDPAPSLPRELLLPPSELVPPEHPRPTPLPSARALPMLLLADGAVVTVSGAVLASVLRPAFGVKVHFCHYIG